MERAGRAVYAHMLPGAPNAPGIRPTRSRWGDPLTSRGLCARAAITLLACTALTVAGAGAASAASPGGWTADGSDVVSTLTGGEGIASQADGSLLYRGAGTIPLDLRIDGWNHVGDPDVADGYTFDNYQGGDDATSKLFTVTTPDGTRYDYTHPLDAGEMLNNSFDAISPDTQWMVAGEWGAETRLQVFPTPLLNHSTPAAGGTLAQAGQITLDHTVNDIQGCDFVSATRLVCASDDAAKDVIQVDLPHALDGTPVTGQVSTLFQVPRDSLCDGTFEAEGIDYDTAARLLRVEIIQPGVCEVATSVYTYRPTTG